MTPPRHAWLALNEDAGAITGVMNVKFTGRYNTHTSSKTYKGSLLLRL